MENRVSSIQERVENQLMGLVDRTLSHPVTGYKIKTLLEATNVTLDDLKHGIIAYTLSKSEFDFGNDHYRSLVSRLTLHFHNLVEGTYHQDRHRLVSSYLEEAKPKHILDIGYGVPGSYLFSYLKKQPEATATLLDMYPSAEDFARILIKNEAPELLSRINFQTYDMDSELLPGDADAYLYLDSIEHTKRPAEYLNEMVKKSRWEAYFIFSLPISARNPNSFHYTEWLTDYEARKWIEDVKLTVVNDGIVHTNPSVDYFAELKPGGFHNYLALTKKITNSTSKDLTIT
ncbi:MAG: hypothetical protein Q8P29_01455 [Candidatus Levybacteria bacterium]|nr:hypothetical protein [Candidatus Levybacteria bacterium]